MAKFYDDLIFNDLLTLNTPTGISATTIAFANVSGTVLIANRPLTTSGYVAMNDPNRSGHIIFREPPEPELQYRRFGLYANAGATTRTSVGIVSPSVTAPTSADDINGIWQRFSTAAFDGSANTIQTTNIISPGYFDISYRFRGGTNTSGVLWTCGLGNPDATVPDPSLSAAALYFMYSSNDHNTKFWRIISCPSDANNAVIYTSSIPVTTGLEYIFRIRRNLWTQDVEFYHNNSLVYTVNVTGTPTGLRLLSQVGVISQTGIIRNIDFSWFQGLTR